MMKRALEELMLPSSSVTARLGGQVSPAGDHNGRVNVNELSFSLNTLSNRGMASSQKHLKLSTLSITVGSRNRRQRTRQNSKKSHESNVEVAEVSGVLLRQEVDSDDGVCRNITPENLIRFCLINFHASYSREMISF